MLVAGNWKMNTDIKAAVELASAVVEAVGDSGKVGVAVCPPYISLSSVNDVLSGSKSKIKLGAQTMHHQEKGAFTGEVSASMLVSVGCSYVILGHSERRQYFGETDQGVNNKIFMALSCGLTPIVCVGETLSEREGGNEQSVVESQVQEALQDVEIEKASQLVVAYEPVWAIGTGLTATPEQAQEMHAFIRTLLVEQYDNIGNKIHILYGGSMKPANALELMQNKDVDGGLIGGASLKAPDFAAIVEAAKSV
ncbi:MAG: triose-phosphate isomerase [Rhodothermaceae bacterium]|nr:triose-phosphate isomerase [Rhodothermaceae bacterium]